MSRRALLRGGPVDGRVIDEVPAECTSIKIPANRMEKYALYHRVGDGFDTKGPCLLFDFRAVYENRKLITP